MIEERSSFLKNFPESSSLVKDHKEYINFVSCNRGLEIDDNNGKIGNIDKESYSSGLSVLFAAFGGRKPLDTTNYKFYDSKTVNYLYYKNPNNFREQYEKELKNFKI